MMAARNQTGVQALKAVAGFTTAAKAAAAIAQQQQFFAQQQQHALPK